MSDAQLMALGLTLAVEGMAAWALARWVPPTWQINPGTLVLAAVGSTAVTHPVGWWILYGVEIQMDPWLAWSAVELAVILSESIAYALIAGLAWSRALTISLVVNVASALAGLALL